MAMYDDFDVREFLVEDMLCKMARANPAAAEPVRGAAAFSCRHAPTLFFLGGGAQAPAIGALADMADTMSMMLASSPARAMPVTPRPATVAPAVPSPATVAPAALRSATVAPAVPAPARPAVPAPARPAVPYVANVPVADANDAWVRGIEVTINGRVYDHWKLLLCCVRVSTAGLPCVRNMSSTQHMLAAAYGKDAAGLSADVVELLERRAIRYALALPDGFLVATRHDWLIVGTKLDTQLFWTCKQRHQRALLLNKFGKTATECAGVFKSMSSWLQMESGDSQVREQLATGDCTAETLERHRIADYTEQPARRGKLEGLKISWHGQHKNFIYEIDMQGDLTAHDRLRQPSDAFLGGQLAARRETVKTVVKRANETLLLTPTTMAKRSKLSTPPPTGAVPGLEALMPRTVILNELSPAAAARYAARTSAKTPTLTMSIDDALAAALATPVVTGVEMAGFVGEADKALVCSMLDQALAVRPAATTPLSDFGAPETRVPVPAVSDALSETVKSARGVPALTWLMYNQGARFVNPRRAAPVLTLQHVALDADTLAAVKSGASVQAFVDGVDTILRHMAQNGGVMPTARGHDTQQFLFAARQCGYTVEQVMAHIKATH